MLLRSIAVALLLIASVTAQEFHKDVARLNEWGEPLGERLLALVPEPADGLDQFAPWDYEFLEVPSWGCPLGCAMYTRLLVERPYVIAEPELASRLEAVEQKSLATAMKIGSNPSDAKLQASMRALEEEDGRLRKSVRRLTMELMVNGGPVIARGVEKGGTPAGTIAGYQVHRFAFNDAGYDPTPVGVRFAVLVGPPGFKNPAVPDVRSMKTDVKTVLVSVSLQTRAETAKADEVKARQLLERVDFAAIEKLLTP
jgi:hypothetical protein